MLNETNRIITEAEPYEAPLQKSLLSQKHVSLAEKKKQEKIPDKIIEL